MLMQVCLIINLSLTGTYLYYKVNRQGKKVGFVQCSYARAGNQTWVRSVVGLVPWPLHKRECEGESSLSCLPVSLPVCAVLDPDRCKCRIFSFFLRRMHLSNNQPVGGCKAISRARIFEADPGRWVDFKDTSVPCSPENVFMSDPPHVRNNPGWRSFATHL